MICAYKMVCESHDESRTAPAFNKLLIVCWIVGVTEFPDPLRVSMTKAID